MHFKPADCQGLSDKEVVTRSMTDLEYFACLVLKYEKRLLSYIQKIILCDVNEAEDILQDGFIKIWTHIRSYDNTLTFENWVFRIVHNEAISFRRKKSSYSKNHLVDIENESIQSAVLAAQDPDFNTESWLKIIDVVLPALKEEYREVLVLKYLESKSYEEISDILKIPEGTVAARINRAKKSFRDLSAIKFNNPLLK